MMWRDGSGLTIVKLGGSLIEAPELRRWLALIAESPGPCLVVPGGGPFADMVRASQQTLGFDDLTAHRMAILAMQQYGLLLQSFESRLCLVESSAEIAKLIEDQVAGIWLPWAMIGLDRSIEPSWEMTSDSLALILAIRSGARRVLLVKSGDMTASDLVDPSFARLRPHFAGKVSLVHRSDLETARLLISAEYPM